VDLAVAALEKAEGIRFRSADVSRLRDLVTWIQEKKDVEKGLERLARMRVREGCSVDDASGASSVGKLMFGSHQES
jgi:hypothetical protein